MAFNYACGQFDDSFSPKRLGNWAEARPSRCLKTRRGVYFRQRPRQPQHQKFSIRDFIANDCGHLLPDVRGNVCRKTNHWGYPVVGVWDELFQCCDGYTQKKVSPCDKECTLTVKDMPKYFRGRSPLAACANSGCSILDDCNMKYSLDLEFERLQSRSPPVIWIYGHPQKAIEDQRLRFSGGLAKKLDFVYINPERVLTVLAMRYLHYSPHKNDRAWHWSGDVNAGGFFALFCELPTVLLECPPSIQRIVALLQNIVCNQPVEAFNTRGILEIIKLLFLTFPSARGYVLDGFPVTLSEADDFETEFWPVTSGIYFTSKQWRNAAKQRTCSNPPIVYPNFFLRSHDYMESLVESTANEFGETCIKLDNAECLNHRDLCLIANLMKDMVRRYNRALCGKEMEFEWDEECEGPKPKTPEESSTPASEEASTSSESSPTSTLGSSEAESPEDEIPEEGPEEEPEDETPEEGEEDEEEVREDIDPDLERFILGEFELPPEEESGESTEVKAFYRLRRDPYSHYIPDKTGVETQFGTGARHRQVVDLLKKEQRPDGPPLSGTAFFSDPAKPNVPLPSHENMLFAEDIGGESDGIRLDEEAYVQKALELEKQKLKQDLADRKYRRKLSYTTYRSEPPAIPETVHTLYPPEQRNFKDETKHRTHEKNSRFEEKPSVVNLQPSESLIIQQDSDFGNSSSQSIQMVKKKPLFEKVKVKWVKLRRYIKPVPPPVDMVSATEKLVEWHKGHGKSRSRRHRKKRSTFGEFRYD